MISGGQKKWKNQCEKKNFAIKRLKNKHQKETRNALFIHFPYVKRITFPEGLQNRSLKKRPWRFKNSEKTNARSRFLQNRVVENEPQKARKC